MNHAGLTRGVRSARWLLVLAAGLALCGFTRAAAAVTLPAPQVAVFHGFPLSTAVAWSPVPGATFYNVYRSLKADGSDAVLVGSQLRRLNFAGFGFADERVESFTTYFYQVEAASESRLGARSAPVSVIPAVFPPAIPASVSARVQGNSIQVAWTPSPDATYYNLYRSFGAGFVTLYRAGITGTTFTDTAVTRGQRYSYFVASANDAGQDVASEPATAVPGFAPGPAPTGLSIQFGNHPSLELTWTAVRNAQRYVIYCSTSASDPSSPIFTTGGTRPVFDDEGLTRGASLTYRVAAQYAGGTGLLSAPLTVTVPFTPTLPPVARAVPGNGSVTLGWNNVEGAATYVVARDRQIIQTGITGTSFTDGGLANGVTHVYQVAAVNAGGQSFPSPDTFGTPGGAPPAAAPAFAGARGQLTTPTTGAASIYWAPVPGATGYNVYRTTSPTAEATEQVLEHTNTSAEDFDVSPLDPSTTFFYQVAAVNAAGEGPKSPKASVQPRVRDLPPPILKAQTGDGSVRLAWSPVAHATFYNIFRGVGTARPTLYRGGLTDTTFTDTGLVNGTSVTYVIDPANAFGQRVFITQDGMTVTPGAAPLPAPTLSLLRLGFNGPVLQWTVVPGAVSYNLYRSTTAGGEGDVPIAQGFGTVFEDDTIERGVTSFYRVAAVSATGEGTLSNEISVPFAAAPLAPPLALTATVASGHIELEWTASPGAASYNVFRATDGANFTLLQSNVAQTHFTDTALSPATAYTYRVAAVTPAGVGPPSVTATASLPDFAPAVAPGTVIIARGDSGAVAVQIHSFGNFADPVTLTLTGAPTGASGDFLPAVASLSGSTLTLSVGTDVAPGDYSLTVTGTAGTVTRSAPLVLRVVAGG
jgi:fibronectin type 3 domain-containing protein